jgi:hypothetical protein
MSVLIPVVLVSGPLVSLVLVGITVFLLLHVMVLLVHLDLSDIRNLTRVSDLPTTILPRLPPLATNF